MENQESVIQCRGLLDPEIGGTMSLEHETRGRQLSRDLRKIRHVLYRVRATIFVCRARRSVTESSQTSNAEHFRHSGCGDFRGNLI